MADRGLGVGLDLEHAIVNQFLESHRQDVLGDAQTLLKLPEALAPLKAYWPYVKPNQKAVFEPGRTSIVSPSDVVLDSRDSPRQAFENHQLPTPWDVQNLIYFAGYAMWTYLTTPFLFKLPNFVTEELEPWHENGETWRGLKVRFPPEVPSHSTVQTFYFDASGLLRRHDYSVDIMGGTSSANYATEHRSFGGIVVPTRRRVYSKAQDGKPMLERVAVAIDLKDIHLT